MIIRFGLRTGVKVITETIRAHVTLVHIYHAIPQQASVGGLCTIPMYTH
jgi:hypothetical protein